MVQRLKKKTGGSRTLFALRDTNTGYRPQVRHGLPVVRAGGGGGMCDVRHSFRCE